MQLKVKRAQNIIQAGTQATASDDGNLGARRLEEDLFARAGALEELNWIAQGERIVVMHFIENESALDGAEGIKPQGRAD
jgi:hypothetical protein